MWQRGINCRNSNKNERVLALPATLLMVPQPNVQALKSRLVPHRSNNNISSNERATITLTRTPRLATIHVARKSMSTTTLIKPRQAGPTASATPSTAEVEEEAEVHIVSPGHMTIWDIQKTNSLLTPKADSGTTKRSESCGEMT